MCEPDLQTLTVPVSGALCEGEKEAEKVIQHPKNHVEDENDVGVDYDSSGEVEPKTNTVPFPQIEDNAEDDTGEETESQELLKPYGSRNSEVRKMRNGIGETEGTWLQLMCCALA